LIAPSTYFEDAEKVRNQPSLSYVKPTDRLSTCLLDIGLEMIISKDFPYPGARISRLKRQPKSGKDDDERSFSTKRRPAVNLTKREIDRGRNKKVSQKIFYPDHILKPSSNLG